MAPKKGKTPPRSPQKKGEPHASPKKEHLTFNSAQELVAKINFPEYRLVPRLCSSLPLVLSPPQLAKFDQILVSLSSDPAPTVSATAKPTTPMKDSKADELAAHLSALSLDKAGTEQDKTPADSKSKKAPLVETDAKFTALVKQVLQDYKWSRERAEIHFPADLSNIQRKDVHAAARSLGLESISVGFGSARHITITKPSLFVDEKNIYEKIIVRKGHIYFEGNFIDAVAQMEFSSVSENMRQKRVERDGPRHHITLAQAAVIENLRETKYSKMTSEAFYKHLLDQFALVPNNWTALGLGMVDTGETKAYFEVIDWPALSKLRADLGLPHQDLHVTIGFSKHDVHDRPKDASTLLTNKKTPTSSPSPSASVSASPAPSGASPK